MKLFICLDKFLNQYLPDTKGMSANTISAYRQGLGVFVSYAARIHRVKPSRLEVGHITSNIILSFLDHIQTERNNGARTRNQRLAALKSMARMMLIHYPEHKEIAETILNIPKKRTQKKLVGYLTQKEITNVLKGIDLKKNEGFRDYVILHLMYDSGARADEVGNLNIDFFDQEKQALAILGKGGHYRQVRLWSKTCELLETYISKYRITPKPLYREFLFINQRGEKFTRHGIYRLCRKHLSKTLSPKRVKELNPAHSLRHTCAMNMLASGFSITDIKNHLGHENIQSTMAYLNLNISHKRKIHDKFISNTKTPSNEDPKINELIDWENRKKTLTWLDGL